LEERIASNFRVENLSGTFLRNYVHDYTAP